ncbi:MAG: class I SAM-dependent rRNA methyltransferase [Anaerolineae bacterium]|jgi:23S rRNA (cytosine1962-C5)-methyltransferase|nr:class I SAM-dependent rRNA methyltransferase [Chloroflexota bacterium]
MITIRLKPGRERALNNRHPWIFSGAIADVEGQALPGQVVRVAGSRGDGLAVGYHNPNSQIAVRILSWDPEAQIDGAFLRLALERAIARRRTLPGLARTNARRLVNAESDGLPGLIVDQYGEWVVLQSLTAGIDRLKDDLAHLLMELLQPAGVFERSDADVRPREGLAPAVGSLLGAIPPDTVMLEENGRSFAVDLVNGHKTGFYLDQRDSRVRVAAYCQDATVLNVFSYTGGFGVYAATAGAAHVVNLDSSAEVLALAERNMALNHVSADRAESIVGDAFAVLRTMRDQARRFDLIVLDPPKFAFSRAQLNSALRGYKDINLQALHLLRPGGILATFSCSGAVDESLFQKVVFEAALDAGRDVQVLERLSQASDHPILLSFPEAQYLKGLICRVG